MPSPRTDGEFRKRIERIESLIGEIDRLADVASRVQARELVQAILDLHGAGLERILEQLASAGEVGLKTIDQLAGDELVASLFLLYGLHPKDMETRVREALAKVRPSLHSHGGDVDLLGVSEGIVRLRLRGSCDGCPSSAMTLKLSIEEAIYAQAPDVTAIEVEDAMASSPVAGSPLHGNDNGNLARANGLAKIGLPVVQR